jgi:hypothetical protein
MCAVVGHHGSEDGAAGNQAPTVRNPIPSDPRCMSFMSSLPVVVACRRSLLRRSANYADYVDPIRSDPIRVQCGIVCARMSGAERRAAPCCAVLCRAVLHRAAPCCTVLCCAVLCCAAPCCAVPCCTVLCCAVLHRAAPCCVVLCCAQVRLRARRGGAEREKGEH